MSDYIARLFNLLTRIFAKEEGKLKQYQIEPPTRYSTPLRCPSRVNLNTSPESEERREFPSSLLGRMSKSASLTSSESALRRSGGGKVARYCGTPFKSAGLLSVQRIENSNDDETGFVLCQETFDTSSPNEVSTVERNPNLIKRSKSDADISCIQTENRLIPEAAVRKSSSYTGYCGSCERPLPMRKFPVKANSFSPYMQTRYPVQCLSAASKIPVLLGRYDSQLNNHATQRHRGIYTLTMPHLKSNEPQNSQDGEPVIGDGDANFKPSDIGNWVEYRNDTSARFERIFKCLSRKKHSIGNVIDSSSHMQWMQLAGINIDKDASMFKQFAGRKVVLNFGEYKFLLYKISTVCDLDYWDLLRKMATFQVDELHHETLLATP